MPSTPETLGYLQAYSDGVNAYLADHQGGTAQPGIRHPEAAQPGLPAGALAAAALADLGQSDGLGPGQAS